MGDKASITEFSKRESDLIFSQVFTDLMNLLKNQIKAVRVEEIAYMTIYNMIKKHDKPLEDFENDENSI
jgi:hypothetical protein